MIETQANGKNKRTRQASAPFAGLPLLSDVQRLVLLNWLRSDALERSWQVLLEAAGADHLETADTLLQSLLSAGVVRIKEEFRHGQWRLWRVIWSDLSALQSAVGLTNAADRVIEKQGLTHRLQQLEREQPWLAAAVKSCLSAPMGRALQASRAALLEALAEWHRAQRSGLRQDFALAARGHTKSITAGEWDWLDTHASLESLGIVRFEPVLWLCGTLSLRKFESQIDLLEIGFLAIPCKQFATPMAVAAGPSTYWLIENRASFERQAQKCIPGTCLIWLPGRPSKDWLTAMRWLLAQAPASANISCDPDPAGIQIALTAGQLWKDAGLPWQANHMVPAFWKDAQTLPLTDYDQRVLAELQSQTDLPEELADLRDYILVAGQKAEQEGWL